MEFFFRLKKKRVQIKSYEKTNIFYKNKTKQKSKFHCCFNGSKKIGFFFLKKISLVQVSFSISL